MKHMLAALFAAILVLSPSVASSARQKTLHIVTTGDVHGSWFDQPYVQGGGIKTSLMSVKWYVDSLRNAVGAENVLLLDAGDCLQGDNAAYYYNYVDTQEPHLFPQLAAYMGYDAILVGNHDIETGHPVYDRVNADLNSYGIPWLGGNAVRTSDGEPYFPVYKTFERAGMKVAVLGFTNANMKAWLSEPLWSGMDFLRLSTVVQGWVDKVRKAEKPDVVIVGVHSGTGEGDGKVLENEALDLLNSLHGVDMVLCGHDHSQRVVRNGSAVLVNGGAHAGFVGYATVTRGKKYANNVDAKIVRLDKTKVDEQMEKKFAPAFEKVKAFTMQHVGDLGMTMYTRDAYKGMCDYINLVHTVQISVPEAQVSFAAPLTFNGTINAGELIYNDMFTIYPYENQMFVVRLKGSEIVDYLEYSYDTWIQTPGEHILKMRNMADPRTGATRWSFMGRSYNFDSAAGLVYTVDVTKPAGSRVSVKSLADGTPFDKDAWYNVAMTSYRANGGGDLILAGAGLKKEEIDSRIVARYPEIREMIYQFIKKHKVIDSALVGDQSVIGEWHFVPEDVAGPMVEADMKLIF